MPTDYRRSHLAAEKGRSYHEEFSTNPYRSMLWEFEQDILDDILRTFYGNESVNHLDFACGTGRVLVHLEKRVQTSVGVDVSESMLEVARKNRQRAELIEADLTRNDVLGNRQFNLITAFRFFPNAEAELRLDAMKVIVQHLHEDGYLVFNNHKNTGSTRNRLARMLGRKNFKGMSITDVECLVAENGLEIVRIYSCSIFPASERHMLLPRVILRPIERLFVRLSFLQGFGENQVFVCRHSGREPLEKE